MGDDIELRPGSVVWVDLEPVRGKEQRGHRPAVVVSGFGYIGLVTALVTVVPITSVDRGWPNHVPVDPGSGLGVASWAMTEQPRTLSRSRITRVQGTVSPGCLARVRRWVADFLDLPSSA